MREIAVPRADQVMAIRSFLRLDGSDGISKNIAKMKKWAQLAEYYKTVKQPSNGHTMEEKAMSWYPKDVQKLDGKWRATHPGMKRMEQIEYCLRRKMADTTGNVNYQVKVLVDPMKPPHHVGYLIDKPQQFEQKGREITVMSKGGVRRIKQLKNVQSLRPKQRRINTDEMIKLDGWLQVRPRRKRGQ